MMAQASLGLAAGIALAAALAGISRLGHGARVSRWGVRLTLMLIVASWLVEMSAQAAPGRTATLPGVLMCVGLGLAYLARDASPAALMTAGLLLAYATLAYDAGRPPPSDPVAYLALAAGAFGLPAVEAAAQAWRNDANRSRAPSMLWLCVSLAVAATVVAELFERGAWFATTRSAALLLAAWVASSAACVMNRGRAWTIAVMAAGVSAALGALSV